MTLHIVHINITAFIKENDVNKEQFHTYVACDEIWEKQIDTNYNLLMFV